MTQNLLSHSEIQGIAVEFTKLEAARVSYLMTGDPAYRAPNSWWTALRNHVEEFARTTSLSPAHRATIATMRDAVRVFEKDAQECDRAVAEEAGDARRRELLARGRESMAHFQELTEAADHDEDMIVAERSALAKKITSTAALLVLIMSLLGTAGLLTVSTLLQTARRCRLVERDRLEWLVREQEALERALDAENRTAEILESMGDGLAVLLRAIIEGSNDLIAAIDADFHYLAFNHAYEVNFAPFFDGVLKTGMRVTDATSEADAAVADWRLALSGERFTIEREIGGEGDESRTYEIRYSSIRDWSGKIVGASHIARDITLHRRAQAALTAANQKLEQEVEERTREVQEKEFLLKEVHHRVKNNLQIVSSLLHMQHYLVADVKAKEAFLESENRVLAMAMIHEFLYQGSTFSRVEIAAYLRRVMDHLSASYGTSGIEHVVTGDRTLFLNLDKAIPCGLVVNELVSNSYKHAFPLRSGQITIDVTRKEGRVMLSVSDNGLGLPPDFALSSHKSLGLKLVETLAKRQLRGTLEMSSLNGTTVHIEFDPGSGADPVD